MNVGSMIKKLRKERHMTQLELSEALNCTKQTISNYEHGRREPDYATLKAIAEALDAPVSLFLTDAEQERMLVGIYTHMAVLSIGFCKKDKKIGLSVDSP